MQDQLLFSRALAEGCLSHGVTFVSLQIILAEMLPVTGLPAPSSGKGGYERKILLEYASLQVNRLNVPSDAVPPCPRKIFPAGQ